MTVGLQVWDASGNLIIDQSTVLGRVIAIIDANTSSGSVSVPGLDQGTPFAIPMLQQGGASETPTNTYPDCTFSGTVVSWTRQAYPSGTALAACKLLLGVH
jgi:hypothetical protein